MELSCSGVDSGVHTLLRGKFHLTKRWINFIGFKQKNTHSKSSLQLVSNCCILHFLLGGGGGGDQEWSVVDVIKHVFINCCCPLNKL